MGNVESVLRSAPIDIDPNRNFRDIGGYATSSGRRVKTAAVYRCGSPHLLCDADVDRVMEAARPRTLIDLRSQAEVEAHPAPSDRLGASYVHLPFPPYQSSERAGRPPPMLDAYLAIAELSGPSIAKLFRVLSGPQNLPALLFCAAGKDRTGVAIALLLGALNVDEESIVEDYARSGSVDPKMLGGVYAERMAPLPVEWHASDPLTMRGFLDTICRDHGSVRRFVASCGVGAAELKALERALLVEQ